MQGEIVKKLPPFTTYASPLVTLLTGINSADRLSSDRINSNPPSIPKAEYRSCVIIGSVSKSM